MSVLHSHFGSLATIRSSSCRVRAANLVVTRSGLCARDGVRFVCIARAAVRSVYNASAIDKRGRLVQFLDVLHGFLSFKGCLVVVHVLRKSDTADSPDQTTDPLEPATKFPKPEHAEGVYY